MVSRVHFSSFSCRVRSGYQSQTPCIILLRCPLPCSSRFECFWYFAADSVTGTGCHSGTSRPKTGVVWSVLVFLLFPPGFARPKSSYAAKSLACCNAIMSPSVPFLSFAAPLSCFRLPRTPYSFLDLRVLLAFGVHASFLCSAPGVLGFASCSASPYLVASPSLPLASPLSPAISRGATFLLVWSPFPPVSFSPRGLFSPFFLGQFALSSLCIAHGVLWTCLPCWCLLWHFCCSVLFPF